MVELITTQRRNDLLKDKITNNSVDFTHIPDKNKLSFIIEYLSEIFKDFNRKFIGISDRVNIMIRDADMLIGDIILSFDMIVSDRNINLRDIQFYYSNVYSYDRSLDLVKEYIKSSEMYILHDLTCEIIHSYEEFKHIYSLMEIDYDLFPIRFNNRPDYNSLVSFKIRNKSYKCIIPKLHSYGIKSNYHIPNSHIRLCYIMNNISKII
jgi:hypothetical protein